MALKSVHWLKSAARGHILNIASDKRRRAQIANGQLHTNEVKVTPRRPKDFTGKAWSRLNVSA